MHGYSLLLEAMLLAVLSAGFVLLGLPIGGILLVLLRRWRPLLWALPLVNLVLFFAIALAFSDCMEAPAADGAGSAMQKYVVAMIPCLILAGWIPAVVLAPVAALLRSITADRPEASGEPDRFLEDYLARPRPSSLGTAFREGCYAPLFGLAYLRTHRSLWRYAIAPIVLNLLVSTFALLLFLGAVAGFAVYIHPAFSAGWGGVLLEIVCGAVLLLLALGATLMTWILLQTILCGYYYEKLARRVEIQLGTRPEELAELPWRVQMTEGLRGLAILIAVNVGFLLLNLVPVLGSIAAVLGFFAYDSYALGAEFLDLPLGLRGWRRKERRKWTRRCYAQTSGLGLVVLLVNFVPLVSSVVLTAAVVGAVLLYRRQEPQESASPPMPE